MYKHNRKHCWEALTDNVKVTLNHKYVIDDEIFHEIKKMFLAKQPKSTGKECICTKDTIKASCPIHGINGINGKENSTRPTLQPIEKLDLQKEYRELKAWCDKQGLLAYHDTNRSIENKLNELCDRINLLLIKNKI
jgi:hypothetical protein